MIKFVGNRPCNRNAHSKAFITEDKKKLDELAAERFGIELDRRKSLDGMYADLKAALYGAPATPAEEDEEEEGLQLTVTTTEETSTETTETTTEETDNGQTDDSEGDASQDSESDEANDSVSE